MCGGCSQALGYTGADIAQRLWAVAIWLDKGYVVGDAWAAGGGAEGEGGCGVCEARECQGRGAAAVQGGWHAEFRV